MNSKILYAKITKILKLLPIIRESVLAGKVTQVRVKNLNSFRSGIVELKELGLFSSIINQIEEMPLYSSSKDYAVFDNGEDRKFITLHTTLIESTKALINIFENIFTDSIIKSQESDTISIKIPTLSSLNNLSETIAKINKAISISIFHNEIQGTAEVVAIYPGSTWIDIKVISTAAVTLIAGLAWSSAVVFKKYQEGKLMEQQMRSLEIRNESMEDIRIAQKKSLDILIDSEAQHLYNQNFKENDPEQKERLKLSIKLFAELLQEGTEIYPALVAPEEVSNLFPDYNKLPLIESKVRNLPQHKKEEDSI